MKSNSAGIIKPCWMFRCPPGNGTADGHRMALRPSNPAKSCAMGSVVPGNQDGDREAVSTGALDVFPLFPLFRSVRVSGIYRAPEMAAH